MNQYTKALLTQIMDTVQLADEMAGGITETSEYVELMNAISAECLRRANNALEAQESRDMNKLILAQKSAANAAHLYEQFQERVREADLPCKYGHLGCSDVEGGRCSDEYHASLSDAARAIVDGE